MTVQSTTGAFVIEACAEQYVFLLSSFFVFLFVLLFYTVVHIKFALGEISGK